MEQFLAIQRGISAHQSKALWVVTVPGSPDLCRREFSGAHKWYEAVSLLLFEFIARPS